MPMPCAAALAVTPYWTSASIGVSGGRNSGIAAIATRAIPIAEHAARQAERQHLQQVDGDDLTAARADALQHGDAAELLKDEDPRHARHGDAAEDHDHQADHAQVVLGSIEVLADRIVRGPERARRDEFVLELLPQAAHQRLDAVLRGTHEDHPANLAAEPDQPRRTNIGEVDEDSRARG